MMGAVPSYIREAADADEGWVLQPGLGDSGVSLNRPQDTVSLGCKPWQDVVSSGPTTSKCSITPESVFRAPGALISQVIGASWGSGALFSSPVVNGVIWLGLAWLLVSGGSPRRYGR